MTNSAAKKIKIFFVLAKKQPWWSSLCHSLVPHTIVDV